MNPYNDKKAPPTTIVVGGFFVLVGILVDKNEIQVIVASGIILIKTASFGAATEAFLGWAEGWDAYEGKHGLDGGIWAAALSGAKAKVPIGALEGIIFAPFAAWQEALKLATKTDDVAQVIGKAEDILERATKGSKGFANLDEFDTPKGSKGVGGTGLRNSAERRKHKLVSIKS